ncbi:Transmembrane protein [Smittium culicis]|uniref:Transmembrane protein n=1 Tax=Smittium culicis TaxID=133412 RepID=A0A1R1YH92_9FUNG|nr:Transmembrane protein [Smittium culicis]
MLLVNIRINGLASIIAGFTVAFKQITPEHNIRLFGGSINISFNNLPAIFMTVVPPLLFLFGRTSSSIMLNTGIFISWIYLRFYKRTGDIRGDLSEAFSFASFFPEFAHPLINVISNKTHKLAIKMRIIPNTTDYISLEDLEMGAGSDDYTIDEAEIEALAESERRK